MILAHRRYGVSSWAIRLRTSSRERTTGNFGCDIEMGTVRTSYNDGHISFEWLKGPLQGQSGDGFIYRARKVGEDLFLVNWHEPDLPGFVTLFIDFKAGQVHSSLIAAYGSDEEQIHFDSASIDSFERV